MRQDLHSLTTWFGIACACMLGAAHAAAASKVTFSDCTEFVGVAPVNEAAARALVPNRYMLIADSAGAKLVVRIADCKAVRVGTLPARPGTVAHIGITIASPDGTGTDPNTSINNYTLTYATNSAALALLLRGAKVPAVLDPDLAYEFAPTQGPSELYASVTPEFGVSPTWFIHGTVTNPSFPTPFLANWWFGQGTWQTKMATDIPTILFDFNSNVSFYTTRNSVVGRLIGSNKISNFPLSFRGQFAVGTMTISVTP